MYTLFQVMTLESWSMGIARPVIQVFPYAWMFFVSYILISTFVVMNIVVGIVLNSIGDSFKSEEAPIGQDRDAVALERELSKLKEQMQVVEGLLLKQKKGN